MSTYLHHLIARARGTLNAVQPRVPARFEAWGGDPVPAVAEARRAVPPSSRTAAPAAPASHAETPRPPAAVVEQPTVQVQASAPTYLQAAARVAEMPEVAPPLPLLDRFTAQAAAALEPIASVQLGSNELTAFPLPPSPPAPGRRDTQVALASRSAAREAHLPVAASVPEETVVHVTIGRIDVRAVAPPPAPAPRPRPVAPARSLEDWLAGRSRP